MELLLKFHWGVCVGRAEDCMLEESFLEDEIFSRGLFPLMGDWRLVSELEDLDLLTGKKERLLGVEVFEDSFSLAAALQERGSRETCWEEFPKPSPSSASSLHWLLYLAALSTAFLARIVVFPRSADRRVSFCRSALLKNESPLSSDLLLRRRSLEETLGERRLVTEELLLELLTGLLSGRLASAVLGWDVRGVALTLDFSARGLVCTKSLLEPLSTSFFLPDTEFLSEELFLEVGEGEAEDWGVEVRDSFPFVPPDTGDSCACKDFFLLEGVPEGVPLVLLGESLFSFKLVALVPFAWGLENTWEDGDLVTEEVLWRFLEGFSWSPLVLVELFLLELFSSTFFSDPELLCFCSLASTPREFWSTALIWLLLSTGSPLELFLSDCVGALQ